MMKANRSIIFLILTSIIFLCWSLESLNVTIMEARNFITAREMVTDGNILIPTMNGVYRLEKPPLPTWLTAISGYFFGFERDWPLRLPAVLMGIMCIWFLSRIYRELKAELWEANLGGWILLTSFYFFLTSRSGMWDIFCHAFMLGGTYYYIRLWLNDQLVWRHALIFGLFTAASIMSKGPVGPYALFLPFALAFHLSHKYETRDLGSKWKPILLGISVAALLALAWPYYIAHSDAGQHAAEVLAKESANWTSYEVKPFYYYWSFPVQSGLWTIFGFSSIFFLLYLLIYDRLDKSSKTALLWTVFCVVLLSLVPEKKSRYLLPVLFPLSYLIASLFNPGLTSVFERGRKIILKMNLLLLAMVFVLGGLAILSGLYRLYELDLANFVPASIILLLTGSVMLIKMAAQNLRDSFAVLVGGFILAVMMSLTSISDQFNSRTAVNAFDRFRIEEELKELPLFSDHILRPEVVWALGRKAPLVDWSKLDPQIDTIGLFSSLEDPGISADEIAGSWKIIGTEVFNQNPVRVGREKSALIEQFRILVRE